MSDTMREVPAGAAAETGSEADYRAREVEARLDRRLAAMEARYARMRWAAVAAGAGLVVSLTALAVAAGSGLPDDGALSLSGLSAQEVTLRDSDGVERGRLATDPGGRAMLSLSDRDGRERIRLTVLADGSPGVTINDPDARPRAVLGYLPDGTTNLVFTDRYGEIRTLVGVGPDGEPSVSVFNEESGGSDESEESEEASRAP